jgi:hypothetical protein
VLSIKYSKVIDILSVSFLHWDNSQVDMYEYIYCMAILYVRTLLSGLVNKIRLNLVVEEIWLGRGWGNIFLRKNILMNGWIMIPPALAGQFKSFSPAIEIDKAEAMQFLSLGAAWEAMLNLGAVGDSLAKFGSSRGCIAQFGNSRG